MNKRFDAVRFMRERRTQIDEEDAGLTWEEKTRKTAAMLGSDPLWQKLQKRRVQAQSQVLPPASTPKR